MKKIAIAVKENGKKVEHFGICEYFIIYDYDEQTHNVAYKDVIFSSKSHDKNSEEWEKSADAIDGCDILICEKIGLVAKTEVKKRGIKILEDEGNTEELLDKFIKIETNKNNIKLP